MFAAAGVYDRRPAYQQRLAALLVGSKKFVGNLPDGHPFGLFRGDAAGHKLKRLSPSGPPLREDPNAGVADHDLLASRHVAHRHATGARLLGIDSNATVDFLALDLDPSTLPSDFRTLVGGAVKAIGKDPVKLGGHQPAVLASGRHAAVIAHHFQNLGQLLGGRGSNLQQGVARVAADLANGNLLDAKRPAACGAAIENFRQDQTVDHVPADLDLLDMLAGEGLLPVGLDDQAFASL